MIAALALALLLLGGAQALPAQGVQSGVAITPDTVTVGDPFIVQVRIRAPRGATIAFPDAPEAQPLDAIEALDPREIIPSTDTTAVEQTARYRMVAWHTGNVPLGLGDVQVRAGGRETRVTLADASIHVRSVLPADSAQRVPKPVRDIIAPMRPLWLYWLIAAVAALILALFIWWYLRRHRRGALDDADALTVAEREFDRIEAMRLVEAGERGRYVALMVDVLRGYLATRYPDAARSLTSWELLQIARSLRHVPMARLEPVLAEVDLVKFARRPVTADRAREIGREARAIVRDVDASERAEAEAAATVRKEAAA